MILVRLVLRRTSSACPQFPHKDQPTVLLDSHGTKSPSLQENTPHSVLRTFTLSSAHI